MGTPASSADWEKGVAAYESGDFATAMREWEPLAEQGDATAQGNLGLMYDEGQGVPQDYKTAVKWYRLAAEQGDAPPSPIWVRCTVLELVSYRILSMPICG